MAEEYISDRLKIKLEQSIIDSHLTMEILLKYNKGDFDHIKAVKAEGFPPVDNKRIINMTGEVSYSIPSQKLTEKLKKFRISLPQLSTDENKDVLLSEKELTEIGKQLMSCYSFGILNGGSATSYADSKKNRSFNPDLFDQLREPFELLSEASRGRAKGITPAFINPDGTVGPSFIELKMRALLINDCPSMFQMTSYFNDESIGKTYKKYENSPYLKDLIEKKDNNICRVKTGIQPLLAAFTQSCAGEKKTLFETSDGSLLPIPGGHGQCFITLKKVFTDLYQSGVRFISIGNVDNIGYTPEPVSLAILALSGKPAGFDFSYKTPVDVKGGILIRDERGHLNCADLGVAIDNKAVEEAERQGTSILFNCATGLFNLEYLVNNIDWIINSLPMRFSDQDKDAGKYSQAEQVTWEVIGLLDDILIFAINKYERFLAAKTIMENLMTSGLELGESINEDLKSTATELNKGLVKKLKNTYGLKLEKGRWIPV
ncbi:MAG: UTP--glucose-1-phosphate uridylyltransferase [Spirochaetaceae bacterium]|nr:UTP--glucose-1-phosphate uridylyltransferase [Spirochaetaceae bacterium]